MNSHRLAPPLVLLLGLLFATACSDESGSDGGGGGTGTVGGGGTGGNVTGLQPAELLPLQPGNTWTYTVTAKVDVPACIEGVRVVTATGGPTEFEGRQAYTLTSLCQDQDTRMALDDGEVLEWIPNFWARALPAPVEAGFTWSSGAGRYTWTDVGSITVPAGTFSDCWERTSADPLVQTNTYCAGVGMVRADEQGHEAVLTSYVVQ